MKIKFIYSFCYYFCLLKLYSNDNSFWGCSNLEAVYIPSSVTKICDGCFGNCSKLTIYGEAGSEAERYAKEKNIKFIDNTYKDNVLGSAYITSLKSYSEFNDCKNTCGTEGIGDPIQAIKLKIDNTVNNSSIKYKTYQNGAWSDYSSNGEVSGSTSSGKALEAIQIVLEGDLNNKYDVYYRAHCQYKGWLGWTKNGEIAGTVNKNYNLEGIQVMLVPKGTVVDGVTNDTKAASEVAQIKSFKAEFKDYDGTVLKSQVVIEGQNAQAPENPIREGYIFTGWDKSYNSITEDIVITATYIIRSCVVTFKDYNEAILKSEVVQYGKGATAPTVPLREGYTFTGWDKSYNNITDSVIITAQYAKQNVTAVYKDYDGTVLKQAIVDGSVIAPSNPVREGYTFASWDVESYEETRIVFIAKYSPNKYTVTFKDYDGTVINISEVEYSKSAIAPSIPIREGYTFISWDKSYNNITSNLEVTAKYTQDVNQNLITYIYKVENGTIWNKEITDKEPNKPQSNPLKDGYTFIGWKEISRTEKEVILEAQYEINKYTVTFTDYDGRVISSQEVEYGQSATAPQIPSREGYEFSKWSLDFINVKNDIIIRAQYEKLKDSNGEENGNEEANNQQDGNKQEDGNNQEDTYDEENNNEQESKDEQENEGTSADSGKDDVHGSSTELGSNVNNGNNEAQSADAKNLLNVFCIMILSAMAVSCIRFNKRSNNK